MRESAAASPIDHGTGRIVSMFERLRRLEISLAAKCQILFGAAVVLIIAAALAVPWHRMEQLTEQLNQRSAGALAENAIAQHVLAQQMILNARSNGRTQRTRMLLLCRIPPYQRISRCYLRPLAHTQFFHCHDGTVAGK